MSVLARKLCILSVRAVETVLIKFLLIVAWRRRARGLKKACLCHLPQVGSPFAEASLLQTPKKF